MKTSRSLLENIDFPAPVISVAIEPKTKADQEKMGTALGKLAQEDPTFRVHTDHDTGQTLISGMGELHLEIIVDRMMREFSVQANVGRPQVAYRETILKMAEGEGKYIKQTGGRGQYGHAVLTVHPLPNSSHEDMHEMSTDEIDELAKQVSAARAASGISTRNIACFSSIKLWAERFPRNLFRRSKTACAKPWKRAFWRATRWWTAAVVLTDGSYHDVDSSEMAFKIAGSMAFKEACKQRESETARADHARGSGGPGRLHGPGDCGPELAARTNAGTRIARRAPKLSTCGCRWRRCSVTPRKFAAGRRGAAVSRCTFRITSRFRETSRKRLSAVRAARKPRSKRSREFSGQNSLT